MRLRRTSCGAAPVMPENWAMRAFLSVGLSAMMTVVGMELKWLLCSVAVITDRSQVPLLDEAVDQDFVRCGMCC